MVNLKIQGFTLLEIVVSMTILVMVVAGGVPAFRKFDDRQRLVQDGRKLVVMLRDAQKRAQSGEKPLPQCNNMTLNSWAMNANSSTSYRRGAYCNGVVSWTETVTLSGGNTFSSSPLEFRFNVLDGSIVLPGGVNTFTLSLRAGSNFYDVELNSFGAVNDKGVR